MGITLVRLGVARPVVAAVLLLGTVVACGSNDDSPTESGRIEIVVTTNILGNIVSNAVGDTADVDVVMPLGTDPHDFAPSARQAEAMEQADLLVINGAGFEAGMLDIIANVADSGTTIFTAADHIDLLTLDDHDDSGAVDPHLWTDPVRVAEVVTALEAAVAAIDGVDATALSASTETYALELDELVASMDGTLALVPDDQRVLVTNHEVFGYFAERFGFEVIGTIVPSLSTGAEPSASAIEDLATLIEDEGVPVVFAETTSSSRLAEVLAAEVDKRLIPGGVTVVELFSESLGDAGSGAETYVSMMETNARLIADALAS